MSHEIYIDDIDRDEMRSGFFVTSDRKKMWNVQLNIIVEFARICKKYNLHWFIDTGSLLGAVRHGGFVPWDDDLDVSMFRPDYEKFKQVAPKELNPKFLFDPWYNYAREGESNPEGLPVVKREQLEKYPWLPFSPILKIKDPNTMYVKYLDYDNLIQCIGLDISPFDPVPPFDNPEHDRIFEMGEEIRRVVLYPKQVAQDIADGKPMYHSREQLEHLMSLPFKQLALAYDDFLAKNYFESEYVFSITFYVLRRNAGRPLMLKSEWLKQLTELPFERIKVPGSAHYEKVLNALYGDWHTPIVSYAHAKVFSADVSCKDYFRLRADLQPILYSSDVSHDAGLKRYKQ